MSRWTKREGCYFIADIAANHNGSIERAIELIHLSAEAGADAAKFQNFKAETIVSGEGFENLGINNSHQNMWNESVFNVYKKAEIDLSWTERLEKECRTAGIDYMTSPYDIKQVSELARYVSAWKIGSGDIDWFEMHRELSKYKKTVFLATGASTLEEVDRAYSQLEQISDELVIMQCNTNYTGSSENYKYVNLSVIRSFQARYPNALVGLSDHTHGDITALGAVALGAVVIEKHFTDDNFLEGPDHAFSMTPKTWKTMVERCRELEVALGNAIKRVEANEENARIVQRRGIRVTRDVKQGETITRDLLTLLRPCPVGCLPAGEVDEIVGKVFLSDIKAHLEVRYEDIR